jgi:hypothetical protein
MRTAKIPEKDYEKLVELAGKIRGEKNKEEALAILEKYDPMFQEC